ncbi:hypothetical protein B484DRAFT_290161, partial [Ochromonadaceae sp. CCMP2298]
IASWLDVNELAAYPTLRVLRLSQIPLFVGRGSSEVRPEAIARIKQLEFFNGSGISPRERVEAEKNYLRALHYQRAAVAKAAASAAGSASTPAPATAEGIDLALHPRYPELIERYGADLIPVSKASSGPSNMAAELISVTFRNLSFISGGTLEPVTKRLPKSLAISRLQLMVKAIFGLDPRLQQLSLRVHKDAPPTVMDDVEATLQYYGAEDGADIFINEAKDQG